MTKIDLAEAVGFDRDALLRNIEAVRPGLQLFEASAKTGAGLSSWLKWLEARRANCYIEVPQS